MHIYLIYAHIFDLGYVYTMQYT